MLASELEKEREHVQSLLRLQTTDIPNDEHGGRLAFHALISGHALLQAEKFDAYDSWVECNDKVAPHYVAPWSDEKRNKFFSEWNMGWAKEEMAVSFSFPDMSGITNAAVRFQLPKRPLIPNTFTIERHRLERWAANQQRERGWIDKCLIGLAEKARRRQHKHLLELEKKAQRQRQIADRLEARTRLKLEKELANRQADEAARARREEARSALIVLGWETGAPLRKIYRDAGVRKTDALQILVKSGHKPERLERIWTTTEMEVLRELVLEGSSIPESAAHLKRPANEVESQIKAMGLEELNSVPLLRREMKPRSG